MRTTTALLPWNNFYDKFLTSQCITTLNNKSRKARIDTARAGIRLNMRLWHLAEDPWAVKDHQCKYRAK